MGATYERVERDGVEVHVSRGKLDPAGTEHTPVWGEWFHEDMGFYARLCQVEPCELQEYANRNPPRGG